MDNFLLELKNNFARALGIDPTILDQPADEESVERFSAMMRVDQRKVKVALALCHLQVPDEIRHNLLHDHLDTTERCLQESFDNLTAQLVAVNSTGGGDEKQAASGAYRLALLMNILGFDNETLKGVLTDPSLTRQAGLIAMTGLNDMGQKIQQLYDEKTK
ncbi:hypothetical protein pEaSNUABM35_00030 [Erwinia phage pEa_SNUABM_35]|uniref:Uncharacterized protein n=1 Tax=Erwinia phage pEa_SNUABM_35 TaxID=2869557 RepID=A0AAE7XPG6_9CAUD|nr:hypothetical protein MPK65_gp030 [Erwinia phage pEa_SNUABM_35]QZE59947.1 hypothetical protein pEaSNUABM35_00030 [Erwinia phage pEa_SNUABM_35]QZE60283.1 hypothetical protein pEaSNUABM36_00030 [Erwinia phage pEa_SNUABM_36]